VNPTTPNNYVNGEMSDTPPGEHKIKRYSKGHGAAISDCAYDQRHNGTKEKITENKGHQRHLYLVL
jgi:hypothetical protein